MKLALCDASRSHNSRYMKILHNTKGVVFFATPHKGSNLAQMGDVLKKVFRASYSLEALRPLTKMLLDLNTEFGELHIPSYSFGESKGLNLVGIVVEQFSAQSGLEDDVFIPVDEDHFSICKPHSRDSQTYHFTYVFLKDKFKSVLEGETAKKEIPANIFHAPRNPDSNTNGNSSTANNKGTSPSIHSSLYSSSLPFFSCSSSPLLLSSISSPFFFSASLLLLSLAITHVLI